MQPFRLSENQLNLVPNLSPEALERIFERAMDRFDEALMSHKIDQAAYDALIKDLGVYARGFGH